MARLLDYQFDTFSTDANGNRITPNAGTLGSANDAVLYTGQFLDADGVDDMITLPQDIVTTSGLGAGEFTIRMTVKFITDSINYMFLNLAVRDIQFMGWSSESYPVRTNGFQYWTAEGTSPILFLTQPLAGDVITFHVVVSKSQGTVKSYANGQVVDLLTYIDHVPSYSLDVSSVFAKFSASSFANIGLSNLWMAYYGLSDSQVLSDYNNPEDFLYIDNGTLTTNDASFDPSTVACWFPFMEGTGNTVYDLVTGNAYAMTNFPTDDTQWTNADELPNTIQKCRYKKDVNGNPSALADPSTIRFD